MDRDALFCWAADYFGVEAEFPWGDRNAVLRRPDNRKWFAAVLEVGRDRLGLAGDGIVNVVNVKCDPRLIGSALEQPGFHRAYHMNKEKWLSIRLDGSVSPEQIQTFVSLSYDLTASAKRVKKHIGCIDISEEIG